MNFVTFILLIVTFGLWFPIVAFFFISIGMLWMICYPIACTAHWFYMRARYGKWVKWRILING